MKKLFCLLIGIELFVFRPCGFCCSDFLLNHSGKSLISARTTDFDKPLDSEVVVVPRGKTFVSGTSEDESYMQWTSQYGFVGTNFVHQLKFVDGLNEKGLSVATFWLEATQYPKSKSPEKTILIADVANWILGSFATVEEVKVGLQDITVIGMPDIIMPFHIAIHDIKRKSLVVEFVKGQMQIYENPSHVMTNDPPFPEQIENLKKYDEMKNTDYGLGMTGLPGDSSSSSRFVLIYTLNRFVQESRNQREAVMNALHILNRVTMVNEEWDGGETEWQVIRDHENLIYYVTHNKNMNLRALDMKKLDFSPIAPILYYSFQNDCWALSANEELVVFKE